MNVTDCYLQTQLSSFSMIRFAFMENPWQILLNESKLITFLHNGWNYNITDIFFKTLFIPHIRNPRIINTESIGVKYSLIVLDLFDLLIGQIVIIFILNWNFRSLSWLYTRQGFFFIKGVLILCKHASHGQFDSPPPNTIRVKLKDGL